MVLDKAASAGLMRRLNSSAILNLIRVDGPIARAEIARRLGMSLPTVMRVVEDLIAADLVALGPSEPSGGRRRTLVEFKGAAHAVIGVDIGGTKIQGTVVDLAGRVHRDVCIASEGEAGPERALEQLYGLIQDLLDVPLQTGQKMRGIAVGAPGVTLSNTGTVVWAPSLGWRDLPLHDLLASRFRLPIFVENDVNLATLGEYGFGLAAGAQNLVCITVGTGIGAGVMLEGRLYRGHDQASGEVGYFLPGTQALGRRYDQFGALEDLASGRGIAARAAEQLRAVQDPLAPQDPTTEDVFRRAREGAPWAVALVEETVNLLSLMIANISALLNPEFVILNGSVARAEDLIVAPIRKRLEGIIPYVPRVLLSDLGPRACAMGAIMMVLDATTGHVMVNQRF